MVHEDGIARQEAFMRLVRERDPGLNRKYTIRTYGCQMNENDSEKLAGMLEAMGYLRTDKTVESDLVIYNTCCVRENAELKVYGHLGSLKALKTRNPRAIIAVCGCMAQQERVVAHILKKYRHVDLVFGTFSLHKLPELLYKAMCSKLPSSMYPPRTVYCRRSADKPRAWSKGMDNDNVRCNNFCSYCIVPYVRGRERSRKPEDIINEARMLGRQGYRK